MVENDSGNVIITDEDFTSPSTFSVGDRGIFVHIVPELATALTLAIGLAALAVRRRRRGILG
ncbi:MAG: hypothetical protein GY842_12175 [bacterium]|nr:hypothetical protein [bacterium]